MTTDVKEYSVVLKRTSDGKRLDDVNAENPELADPFLADLEAEIDRDFNGFVSSQSHLFDLHEGIDLSEAIFGASDKLRAERGFVGPSIAKIQIWMRMAEANGYSITLERNSEYVASNP